MKTPWVRFYYTIRQRTTGKRGLANKNYGGRGIKCLITKDDLKTLWIRDKAEKMLRPSIDRIDVNGNYELSNCRFLELKVNAGERRKSDYCVKGHPLSGENLKLRITKQGWRMRVCIACLQDSRRKWDSEHPERNKRYRMRLKARLKK